MKSKLYSKYGKQLYVTAKNGVADPEASCATQPDRESQAGSSAGPCD